MEKFDVLVKKIGFGNAVIKTEEKLSNRFFEKLSSEEWLYIFDRAVPYSELKTRAVKELKKCVTGVEGWVYIYKTRRRSSSIARLCLKQIDALANLDELVSLCDNVDPWSDFEEWLLSKIERQEISKERWKKIAHCTKSARLRKLAENKSNE